MPTKNEIKQYSEFEKSRPVQLDLFSFNNIFESKRDKYSGSVDLYDIIPKYFFDDLESVRKNGKYLDILSREFVYKKEKLTLNITPAKILQNDKTSKDFYPSQREEIIEDVLRKFATNSSRNEFLDDRLSVKFTLYDLWKELRKIKHFYDYNEIRESLNILSKTNLEIKSKDGNISFSSNMFETFGTVNNNLIQKDVETEEESKKVTYFVRFNSLVSESIKNKTWRVLNYDQCMQYKKFISRWLHKRISHLFLNNKMELPYNIMLSSLVRDSGMTKYQNISMTIKQIEDCLKEMIRIGSIWKYEIIKIMSEEKSNRIEDVKFLIFTSKSFLEDMKLNYLDNKDQKNIEKYYKEEKLEEIELLNNLLEIFNKNEIIIDQEKIKLLIEKNIDKKENIVNNIKAAIKYIKNQISKKTKCNVLAIFTKSIKENWEINLEVEENLLNINQNIEIINQKIKSIIDTNDERYKKIITKIIEEYGEKVFKKNFSEREMLVAFFENEIILFFRFGLIYSNVNCDYIENIRKIILSLFPDIKKISTNLNNEIFWNRNN